MPVVGTKQPSTVAKSTKRRKPALLSSYAYLARFLNSWSSFKHLYRDWMIDSGAFTAYNSGNEIDIQEYIKCCKSLLESDDTLSEIIALDVIGSGEGSLRNAQVMRDAGLSVIPVFHYGEDWGLLKEYCAGWGKVGLSCRFGEPVKDSLKFYGQCFARAWPKKFHSFGWVAEKMLLTFPFHSSDSADWEIKPCQFGTWRSFGKPGSTAYLNVRGGRQNLRTEIDWYLDLERRLQERWKKEMTVLGEPGTSPVVRLVVGSGRCVDKSLIESYFGD